MATIKSLLRTAGMNIGARAFEPDASRVIVIGNTGNTYVAPNDGWVCVQAVSTENGAYANVYTDAVTVSESVPYSGNSVQVLIPVKKGDTVHMYEGSVESLIRKFVPALGGGVNRFIINGLGGFCHA